MNSTDRTWSDLVYFLFSLKEYLLTFMKQLNWNSHTSYRRRLRLDSHSSVARHVPGLWMKWRHLFPNWTVGSSCQVDGVGDGDKNSKHAGQLCGMNKSSIHHCLRQKLCFWVNIYLTCACMCEWCWALTRKDDRKPPPSSAASLELLPCCLWVLAFCIL